MTYSYFSLLGVRPAVGRFFAEEEDRVAGGARVIVLGYNFWQQQFTGNPNVIGHNCKQTMMSIR
ncbi:MAG: ABC transporter permease [Pyrinomonadaceae bacterium]